MIRRMYLRARVSLGLGCFRLADHFPLIHIDLFPQHHCWCRLLVFEIDLLLVGHALGVEVCLSVAMLIVRGFRDACCESLVLLMGCVLLM